MARALAELIQKQKAMVRQRHLARYREVSAADQLAIRDRMMRGPKGGFVTTAVRAPVRPAMLWMRVASIASAKVIAGRMVVSLRASIDLPPRRAKREDVWVRMSASHSVCSYILKQ